MPGPGLSAAIGSFTPPRVISPAPASSPGQLSAGVGRARAFVGSVMSADDKLTPITVLAHRQPAALEQESAANHLVGSP
jgi:hypothetical protein